MQVKKVQNEVLDFFKSSSFREWPKFAIIAKIYSELAEITDMISIDEGFRQRFTVDNINSLNTFGEVFFELIHLANECNVDLEEALTYVLKKYKQPVDVVNP